MNLLNRRVRGLYILDAPTLDIIYGSDEQRELAALVDFYAPPQTRESIVENLALLADAEIIISGWGAPRLDATFLAAAPQLRAVFYGGGSIRGFTTPAFWQRGVMVTSAYVANAVPVSEYTLSTILLSLKHFWRSAAQTRLHGGWGDHTRWVPGGFRSTVGMISCGIIARKTLEMLRMFDLHRLIYCPFLSAKEAVELGVERCTLSELFRRSDVVSLHTPDLPETRGLITGEHFRSMKQGATFINTARGAVVRENEMIEALQTRSDLTAILDVCHPEPPASDSALLKLSNVILTPHIAGSLGPECRRLGHYMVEEVRRFVSGEALNWQITEEQAARLA